MHGPRFPRSFLILLSTLSLLCTVARADFTKTIQGVPNTPVQAATTWYYASCTQSLGVGSYSVNVAPMHGSLSFSTVSGPLPGCPAGSPSLPAAAAFYTWTDTSTTAATDYFQLYFLLGGQVAEVLDITVDLTAPDNLAITTKTLPNTISGDPATYQLAYTGGQGPVTWSLGGGSLPDNFTLSSSGVLSNSGNPPPLADPGTYTFTVTASDSHVSVSQQLSLDVISENCADTESIDATKIDILTYLPLTFITSGAYARIDSGFTIFGTQFVPRGIVITAPPAAITYSADGLPPSDIQTVYVQNLTNWSGFADYTGPGGLVQEWGANPIPSDEVDYASSAPPPYYAVGLIFDSPGIIAPFHDRDGRQLSEVHYNKQFTAYIGCHTARDTAHFSTTDPKYYIRTLATVVWGVNFSGDFSYGFLNCFSPRHPFNCVSFDPDSDAGVYYALPQSYSNDPDSAPEPVITPRVSATYQCFGGTGACP